MVTADDVLAQLQTRLEQDAKAAGEMMSMSEWMWTTSSAKHTLEIIRNIQAGNGAYTDAELRFRS